MMQTTMPMLDREETALDVLLRTRVAEALVDPRPSIPLAEGMAAVRAACDGESVFER